VRLSRSDLGGKEESTATTLRIGIVVQPEIIQYVLDMLIPRKTKDLRHEPVAAGTSQAATAAVEARLRHL